MPKYKIADIVFEAQTKYAYTVKLCEKYQYFGEQPCAFKAIITEEDILAEKKLCNTYPDAYLESLALFRKLCDYILKNANGFILHSSAIMVDGKAYLFTAPSGTGKSSHAKLWRELLGDRAVMINDDKPIVRFVDGDFFVYGTPWNGKHKLGENCKAKIKAICALSQEKENLIRKATVPEMLLVILNQTIRPKEIKEMDTLLALLDKMLKSVEIYKLGCNLSLQAAQLSYTTMSGEKL